MNFLLLFFTILSISFVSSTAIAKAKASAEQAIQVLDEPTPTPLPAATPTPVPKPRTVVNESNAKTLVLHKPATNPAWGRVVEYRKETAQSNVDKTTETLHVFLFQDDQGVVRTAVYHEGASGDGYWEVLVWDR